MRFSHALGALTAALSFHSVHAGDLQFRVTCSPFKRERIDAVVSPGKEASHMHTFFGSRAIGPDSITSDELRASCHTCDNTLDHSAYWMPTLYYVTKNATVPVKVAIFHVYYHGQNENREPFPEDFAILSGNPSLTEEQAKEQGGIGTSWHFETSDEVKEDWQLPAKKGGGWLRANVPFPTNVVKDESLGRYRECSTDEAGCFSVIRMFFAVWYDLRNDFFSFEDGDYLALSSGGGQTYHGDFIYGWDKEAGYDLVRKQEGASTSKNQSSECMAQNEQDPFLGGTDWDAMLEAQAGNGSVQTGTYDRYLTITDGKSINTTWTGAWGEGAGNSTASNSTASSSAVSISTPTPSPLSNSTLASTILSSSTLASSTPLSSTLASPPASTLSSQTISSPSSSSTIVAEAEAYTPSSLPTSISISRVSASASKPSPAQSYVFASSQSSALRPAPTHVRHGRPRKGAEASGGRGCAAGEAQKGPRQPRRGL